MTDSSREEALHWRDRNRAGPSVDARPHRRGGLPVGKVLAEPQELTKLKIFEVTPIAS